MNKPQKKTRIFKEQAKDRHTTHWDMDYLPRKEVEALYAKSDGQRKKRKADTEGDPGRIGWTLILVGLGLLILSLVLIRFVV